MKINKKSVQETVQKEMPEFADAVAGLSPEELNQRLAQLTKDSAKVQQAKEEDEKLKETSEQAKELGAPYREAKKAISLKVRYVIGLLKERGSDE